MAASDDSRPLCGKFVFIYIKESVYHAGQKGELYISGICLARGYKGQPQMTADRFVANTFAKGQHEQFARMYKTGDEACWRGDGVLVFLGRVAKDAQVLSVV